MSSFTPITATTTPKPTWLITGTSSGLGLALSQHVLRQNHNLISLSRHPQPDPSLTSLVDSLSTSNPNNPPPKLHHIQHDLSTNDETAIKSKIAHFLSTHPELSIDILVNNAAITAFSALETIPTSTVQTCMTVNFYSPLWIIQACLPIMRRHSSLASPSSPSGLGIPKVIMNISSTQGLCSDPSELAYDASKHALEALTGVLAKEVGVFGIRTVVVNLGSFRTAFATSGDRAGLGVGKGGADDSDGHEPSQRYERVEGKTDKQAESEKENDPYTDPYHPVKQRIDMVMKLASVPDAAKGDPVKGASILFDAVMRTPGSVVDEALAAQEVERSGGLRLERLFVGSDGPPKIRRQVEVLRMQIESCEEVARFSDADDVR